MKWGDWLKAGFTGFVALSAAYTVARFFQFFGVSQAWSLALSAPVLIAVLIIMIRGFNPQRR
ncbi:MAG TPA: hypothetical protein VG900_09405 [Hyphomicrobiaceae bacterium]|jgi:hypothetical protein|nr:hypothetical protein [Hyphomicrobiaceae bacterium]